MQRLLCGMLTLGFYCACCGGQQSPSSSSTQEGLANSSWLKQIEACEMRIREAEVAHADRSTLAHMYSMLATTYQNAGVYTRAEAALKREVALLNDAAPEELAGALGQVAALHLAIGQTHSAEKEQERVLKLRERAGDPRQTALAWNDLAGLYVRTERFDEALKYATKAMTVLGNDTTVDVHNRIAVRQTLAVALCGVHRCSEAISLLSIAAESARENLGSRSLDAGVAEYLLGNAYWQSGNPDAGGKWMAEGIEKMRGSHAYGRTPYLHAMTQYARFLRERGQLEKAAAADREVRVANSMVDASALRR